MCHNLSWYWVLCCFLTPLFVLLGANVKSRCLGKLSHPSLLSRQAQTVIFISKIAITTVAGYVCLGWGNRKLIRWTTSPILKNNCGTIEEHWMSQIVVTTIPWFILVSLFFLQAETRVDQAWPAQSCPDRPPPTQPCYSTGMDRMQRYCCWCFRKKTRWLSSYSKHQAPQNTATFLVNMDCLEFVWNGHLEPNYDRVGHKWARCRRMDSIIRLKSLNCIHAMIIERLTTYEIPTEPSQCWTAPSVAGAVLCFNAQRW